MPSGTLYSSVIVEGLTLKRKEGERRERRNECLSFITSPKHQGIKHSKIYKTVKTRKKNILLLIPLLRQGSELSSDSYREE